MSKHCLALLAGVAALALTSAASAQDHSMMPGMSMPGMKMPPAKKAVTRKPPAKRPVPKTPAPGVKPTPKKPAAKKPVARKPAVRKPAAGAATATKTANPHAGHNMSSMPGMEMPAGHQMPAGQMPPDHDMSTMPRAGMPAGHDMSSMPGMDMPAGHDMSTMGDAVPTGTDLPAGSTPPPPIPTDRAADSVYGPDAMQMGRHHLDTFHGGQKFSQVMFNIAEAQVKKGRDGFQWDAEAWYGGDINRLWLKSEGDGEFGRAIEKAEIQALYSHAIGPYFNLQGGVRYDFKPNPSRTYATVAIEGLAPSFFDVEGALFVSNKGELMARAEGYYDQRITQRLILQPRVELNFAAQNSPELGVGAGLIDAEVGLRLRYDIRREFAPYVGVQYRRSFGNTRDYQRAAGEDTGVLSAVAGIRFWF
ncbi:copper resistance protein B [Parablastomonas sp. CN1-191]|uniref:copper resistance protein B n=1 Tax=Parablastomonas sp. CN1-191 TaxID=3400908 RepID=UPI003BF87375